MTGRSPDAARTVIRLVAVPGRIFGDMIRSSYVPPPTSRVSPAESLVSAVPIVRQGLDRDPSPESEPLIATWYVDPARIVPAAAAARSIAGVRWSIVDLPGRNARQTRESSSCGARVSGRARLLFRARRNPGCD